MESLFGLENMAKEAAVARMIRSYEQEIHEVARVSHLIKQSFPARPAWYSPLLAGFGGMLISFGTRLKARYSVNIALPAQSPESCIQSLRRSNVG